MKARDIKKWLRATPSARHGVRYSRVTDILLHFYVPQLCGRDIVLLGDASEYSDEIEAIAAAKRFQDAIRENHPEMATN